MQHTHSLEGKRALVTGATSGIGLGLARAMADAGAQIAITGLGDPADIDAIVADLSNRAGASAAFVPANLTDAEQSMALVPSAEVAIGPLDIVLNNAGTQHVAAVEDFPPERWQMLINLNLSAAFYTTKAALPGMKARGFGRIINLASAHGLVASPFKSAYVAAKHGLVGFTKSLALEIAEEADITANAICPGYVKTPLVEGQIADQARAHGKSEEDVIRDIILAAQPNKRFVEIDELAALVLLLASEQGRSFNGSALAIDGGWTAR